MRTLAVAIVLVLALSTHAGDGLNRDYVKRDKRLGRKVAAAYERLAKDAVKKMFYGFATECHEAALRYDPSYEPSRKWLGYRKVRNEWVLDPRVQKIRPRRNMRPGGAQKDIFNKHLRDWQESRDKTIAKYLKDYVELARWTDKKKLERESEVAWGKVLAFDNDHAEARKALGFIMEDGAWVRDPAREGAVTWEAKVRFTTETRKEPRLCQYGATQVVAGSTPSARSHVFKDDLFAEYFMNPEVLRGTVAGRDLVFFDADFDGVYFESGVDWVGEPDSRYAVTYLRTMVIGNRRLTLSDYDEKKQEAVFKVERLGLSLSVADQDVYGFMNDVRLAHGLHPAELDEKISQWCRKHNNYMKRNAVMGHFEDPKKPGYSKEGNTAGVASIIAYDEDGRRSLLGLLDSPLHGYALGHPSYTKTALSAMPGYLTVWKAEKDGMEWIPRGARFPAVFPPNLARGVPIDWTGEIPDPRDNPVKGERWGYPIRIYLKPGNVLLKDFPTNVSATLTHTGVKETVPVQITSNPENFPHLKGAVKFTVMPRVALAKNTLYHFHAEWTYVGRDYVWDSTFTTGTQQGQRRGELDPGEKKPERKKR